MSESSWKTITWGEIATLEYGKSLRDYRDRKEGIPVFGTNGQIGYTDEALCEFASVIVGRKGAYRGVHYSSEPFFVIDTAFYLKPKVDELDLKFAYYNLLTKDINSMDSGSAIPSTSREDFYNLDLFLPPLPTQRRIAAILSAFDDKIELNRRMNQTLEAMAQALFREMCLPKGEELPAGWAWKSLLDFAKLIGGGTPKTKVEEYWDGDIGWISAKDVTPNDRSFVIETERSITELGLKNSSAKLLPKFSTVLTARGTVGKYCITSASMAISQSNYALTPVDKNSFFFLFQLIGDSVAKLQQRSYGTVFDTITTKTLKELRVIIPPLTVLQEFEERVRPIMMRVLNNLGENIQLGKTRDTLLPKLMAGEIIE